MALAAVAPTYPLVMLAVLAAGVGVAAYHPEGSKFASYVSGERRASGMAFFSVGGNLGFALGPVLASGVVIALGLTGGLLIALPGLVVAVGLLAVRPTSRSCAERRRRGRRARGRAAGRSRASPLRRRPAERRAHGPPVRAALRSRTRPQRGARNGAALALPAHGRDRDALRRLLRPTASAGAPCCSAASSSRRR